VGKLQTDVTYAEPPNFPEYLVGDDGSVWSRHRNTRKVNEVDGWHQVFGKHDRDGYRTVILCHKGKRRYVRVHALVLEVFRGPAPKELKNPTAAHDNGVRDDNRLSNLNWKSHAENCKDKIRHRTHQIGERHPSSRLTETDVREIRKLRSRGESVKAIAEHMNHKVRPVTIYAVLSGRLWLHVK